jgi:hypothetical protein
MTTSDRLTMDRARDLARSYLYGAMGHLGITVMTDEAVESVASRLFSDFAIHPVLAEGVQDRCPKHTRTLREGKLLCELPINHEGNHREGPLEWNSFGVVAQPAESAAPAESLIKHMVNRFLSWRLPENFKPDGGISFKRTFNEHTAHPMKAEPTGTNLLDATQAEEMIRYLFAAAPAVQEAGTGQVGNECHGCGCVGKTQEWASINVLLSDKHGQKIIPVGQMCERCKKHPWAWSGYQFPDSLYTENEILVALGLEGERLVPPFPLEKHIADIQKWLAAAHQPSERFSCGKHYGLSWTGRSMCPQCQAEQEEFVRQREADFGARLQDVRKEFMR